MSLAGQIQVNTNYTRSINLERDADSLAVVNAYIPTTRALDTLARVGETITTVKSMPRAWTLMGPYGSGKSSFAVFLSHLLGATDDVATDAAQAVLACSNEKIIDSFWDENGKSLEHCRVFLTGSPEPMSKRLAKALHEGSTTFFSRGQRQYPLILEQLARLAAQDQITVTEAIDTINQLQEAVAGAGGYGVLIVIDELGKFLEYEAYSLEKRKRLDGDGISIILDTYSTDRKDAFIYLIALIVKRNGSILKDENLLDAIKIFEEYCNAGLEEIQLWLDENPKDHIGIDTLFNKVYDQVIKNESSNKNETLPEELDVGF